MLGATLLVSFMHRCMRTGAQFFSVLVQPRSRAPLQQRREFIVNVILVTAIGLCLAALISNQNDILQSPDYSGVPAYVMPIVFLAFCCLFLLSRAGFHAVAAYCIVGMYFISATFTLAQWGADLPIGVLVYALLIVMSGALISTKWAFTMTVVNAFTLTAIWLLQSSHILQPDSYWKDMPPEAQDVMIITFIFASIAVVSWLFNREIERALNRALRSEASLKAERDQLEMKVDERTRDLRQAQFEKMSHLYRLAEMGKVASGFFHDLVNPLTVVSLNLERLSHATTSTDAPPPAAADVSALVTRAMSGTQRIEQFVQAAQKQIKQQSAITTFSLADEIRQVIQMLQPKAAAAGVRIEVHEQDPIWLRGDSVKFYQVVSNLIANAIDACEAIPDVARKHINIQLSRDANAGRITIHDQGCGIAAENLEKIFNPFFTTKSSARGMGIGLAITKHIVEHDFNGSIHVTTVADRGSTFTITLPLTAARQAEKS